MEKRKKSPPAVFVALDINFVCTNGQISANSSDELIPNSSFVDKCDPDCVNIEYETNVGSIFRDFNLVCEGQQILASVASSAYWVAYLISSLTCGFISDKYGRKLTSLMLVFILFVSTAATTFAPDIYTYIALRFMAGLGAMSAYLVVMIMTENVGKEYLSRLAITTQLMFVLGQLACVLTAYEFETSWRMQYLVMALPLLPYMFVHVFFLPESPRWLHSVGQFNEAEKNLKYIARLNGNSTKPISLPQNISESTALLKDEHENSNLKEASKKYGQKTVKTSVFDLFRTMHSCMLTSVNMLAWFACSLVYYGLMYNVKSIDGDLYLNSLLLSVTEIPSWFASKAIDKYGRKKVFYITLFIASVSCAAIPFTDPIYEGQFQIAFAMAGKCLATACYNILFVHCPEQFPTVLRSTGISLCAAGSRIASILTPFIIKLDFGPHKCAPFEIFAVAGLLSSLAVFMFGVETLNKPFITTVEEYEKMADPKTRDDNEEHERN